MNSQEKDDFAYKYCENMYVKLAWQNFEKTFVLLAQSLSSVSKFMQGNFNYPF